MLWKLGWKCGESWAARRRSRGPAGAVKGIEARDSACSARTVAEAGRKGGESELLTHPSWKILANDGERSKSQKGDDGKRLRPYGREGGI